MSRSSERPASTTPVLPFEIIPLEYDDGSRHWSRKVLRLVEPVKRNWRAFVGSLLIHLTVMLVMSGVALEMLSFTGRDIGWASGDVGPAAAGGNVSEDNVGIQTVNDVHYPIVMDRDFGATDFTQYLTLDESLGDLHWDAPAPSVPLQFTDPEEPAMWRPFYVRALRRGQAFFRGFRWID